MALLNYTQLENKIIGLAEKINAPQNLLPTYKISSDGALPHIVIDEPGSYHIIVVERGQELEHRKTGEIDELLYWIFETVTFSMACSYELKHRVSNQDFRILLFKHQEKLLGELRTEWQQKKHEEHNSIVEGSPFSNDFN